MLLALGVALIVLAAISLIARLIGLAVATALNLPAWLVLAVVLWLVLR